MLSRFHLIPERIGRTERQADRRTYLLYQYRASVCWRAIKKIAEFNLFASTEYTNVIDGRTDTARRHRPRSCIASRGENAMRAINASFRTFWFVLEVNWIIFWDSSATNSQYCADQTVHARRYQLRAGKLKDKERIYILFHSNINKCDLSTI